MTTQTNDLDPIYGPSSAANGIVHGHETSQQPESLMELNATTAPLLKEYLECKAPMAAVNVMAKTCHLLWIIDPQGRLFFAVEEMIDEDGELIGVLPKSIDARPATFQKLGHPSLLSPGLNKDARIAGEIEYDPVKGGPDWVLTNSSRRYGTREQAKPEHLDAVAGMFNDYGLYFRVKFFRLR